MFENKFFTTKQMGKEYITKIVTKSRRILYAVFFFCGLVILAGIQIFNGWHNHSFTLIVITLFLLVYSPFMFFYIPTYMYKWYEKQSKTLLQTEDAEAQYLFGDNISFSEGKVSGTFEYSQIIKIDILKLIDVLHINKHQKLIVSKTGFTNGTNDDFLLFMREKCVNAKKNKYIEALYKKTICI